MDAKTYRAANTQTALEMVQDELGPNAMIVSVRQVPAGAAWEVWKAPEVEVIAVPGGGTLEKKAEPAPAKVRPEDVQMLIDQLALRLTQAAPDKQPAQQALPAQPAAGEQPKPKAKTISPAVFPVINKSAPASRPTPAARPAPRAEEPRRREAEAKPVPAGAPKAAPAAAVPTAVAQPETRIPARRESRPASSAAPAAASVSGAAAAPTAAPAASLPPALRAVFDLLSRQGVEKNLISKALSTCAMALNRAALGDALKVRAHIRSQLEASVRSASTGAERLVCLIGASGSGKTSLCAKLAAAHKEKGRKVVWICADTIHTGAIALARAYTDTLGIPLRLAYTPEELAETVKAESSADLILVDTAAVNPVNRTEVIELGAYLTTLPARSTYLVAPATAKEADLNEAAAAFGLFKLNGVVLTKVDETGFYGAAYNFLCHSHLPLAYFSRGRRILEDFQPADARAMVGLLMGKE